MTFSDLYQKNQHIPSWLNYSCHMCQCLNIDIFISFFQPKRTPLLVREVQFWVNWDQLERVGEDYGGGAVGELWKMWMGVWGGGNPSRGGASGLLPLPGCRLQHILTDGE